MERRTSGTSLEPGFGSRLRAAREARGISLRDVAHATKISAAILEGLENDDPSKLPGGIFSRSFVRAFASHIGLDPEETLRDFHCRFPEHAPLADPVAEDEAAMKSERPSWAAATAVVALVALAGIGGAVAWFDWPPRWPAAADQDASSRGSQPSGAPVSTPGPPIGAPDGATPTGTGGTGTGGTVASPGAAPAAAPTSASAAGMRFTVQTRDTCWVRLTVDGKVALARLMREGDREEFVVSDAVKVELGNAGAFDFAIDGQPGRSLGGSGEVVRMRIARANAADFVSRP